MQQIFIGNSVVTVDMNWPNAQKRSGGTMCLSNLVHELRQHANGGFGTQNVFQPRTMFAGGFKGSSS
jgi:hypothetical protein